MFKYLKRLVQEVMIHSQQLVGRNVQTFNSEETPEETNTARAAEPRESPRPRREKKSFSKNEDIRKNSDKEKEAKPEKVFRCYAKRFSPADENKEREISIDGKEDKTAKKNTVSEENCRCENCTILSTFNECGVCLESLQNRGVKSCPVCANIVCSKCAEKLQTCPFCRSAHRMQKNRAIERMLDGLFLPCRNARSGCRKIVNSETRSRHEASCHYTSISCPVSQLCRWNGSSISVLSHLKKVHGLKPLVDRGLTVEIPSFRQRTMNRDGEYTIYLSCYGQLLAVKVRLSGKKFILSFSQLGYVTRVTEEMAERKYGVWIKVKVAEKQIRGVLPFGKFHRESRKIEINYETLCPKQENISGSNDKVKIYITVREIKSAFNS